MRAYKKIHSKEREDVQGLTRHHGDYKNANILMWINTKFRYYLLV